MKGFDGALRSQLCFSLLSPLGGKPLQLLVWPGLNLARTSGSGQVLVLLLVATSLWMLCWWCWDFSLSFPITLLAPVMTRWQRGGSPGPDGGSEARQPGWFVFQQHGWDSGGDVVQPSLPPDLAGVSGFPGMGRLWPRRASLPRVNVKVKVCCRSCDNGVAREQRAWGAAR